jgi:uncharacterized membrane protein YhaH (DUF805 family)
LTGIHTGFLLKIRGKYMSFGDAIKSFFTNYAKFNGRARRSEFWFSYLFVYIVSIVLNIVIPAQIVDVSGTPVAVPNLLVILWSLAVFIPQLAMTWRRLHDTNTSGGYFFMALIPLVGIILLIVKLATAGTPAQNRFGNPVK